jgi:sulfotransferase
VVENRYHFISGLPRSGSTLLSAILRQNPLIHADISSPLHSLFSSALATFSVGSEHAAHVSIEKRKTVLRGLFESYYKDSQNKSLIFDTSRGWTTRIAALLELFPDAKIICCVRDVSWILDSFERQYQKQPFENTKLFNDDTERNTIYSRVDTLAQRNRLVGYAWSALKEAFYGERAASLLLVDYELLAQAPERTVALIYQFLGQDLYVHNYDYVEFEADAFDNFLGIEGLHRVSGPVVYRPRQTILPPDLFEKYSQMNFWKDVTGSNASVITAKHKENVV